MIGPKTSEEPSGSVESKCNILYETCGLVLHVLARFSWSERFNCWLKNIGFCNVLDLKKGWFLSGPHSNYVA
jgi:hypothetical protein